MAIGPVPSEQAAYLEQGAAGQGANPQPGIVAAEEHAQAGVVPSVWEEVGHLLASEPTGHAGCPSCTARCRSGVAVMLTALQQRAFVGRAEANWGAAEGAEGCGCLPHAGPCFPGLHVKPPSAAPLGTLEAQE